MTPIRPSFKAYYQDQIMLLPSNLEDLVPKGHPARVVNDVLDRIKIAPFQAATKGGGTSNYNPRLLLNYWFMAK